MVTAALRVLNDFIEDLNHKQFCVALCEAFDTVDHSCARIDFRTNSILYLYKQYVW